MCSCLFNRVLDVLSLCFLFTWVLDIICTPVYLLIMFFLVLHLATYIFILCWSHLIVVLVIPIFSCTVCEFSLCHSYIYCQCSWICFRDARSSSQRHCAPWCFKISVPKWAFRKWTCQNLLCCKMRPTRFNLFGFVRSEVL